MGKEDTICQKNNIVSETATTSNESIWDEHTIITRYTAYRELFIKEFQKIQGC